MVTGGVKAVFHELQCDFEQPTREGLQAVVDELANKSAAWGTPRSIILHHHTQIQRLLAQLH